MYPFRYHRPASLAEAAQLFAAAEEPRYLGGGQTLLPALKMRLNRVSDLIDLGRVGDLSGIAVEQGTVVVGALARHHDVAVSPVVRSAIPALARLAGAIADPHIRNMGTLGGSLANNDPAGDYAAAVLGLGATIHTDRRTIDADAFFTGMFETALEPGEIVAGVSFPIPTRAAYVKFPNPASRYAVVGVFVAETVAGPRVAVTGAASCVFRHVGLEAALTAAFRADVAAAVETAPDGLNDDLHATAEYRAHLIGVMARRAVALAVAV